MTLEIIKRDGSRTTFHSDKIVKAIYSCFHSSLHDHNAKTKSQAYGMPVVDHFLDRDEVTVEEVQDIVEKTLMENQEYDAVKSFMIYRYQHQRSVKDLFSNIEMVDSYLEVKDWRVKESANSSYSLQGLNQHISTLISSQYWLNELYPKEIAQAHEQGALHIHDLGFLSVYCVGWDLEDLILTGFKGVEGKIESDPAKHLRTMLGQIVNFFYTMQGEAAGAQAFSNFDTLMAPFIHYDQLTFEEVKQAIQEFLFNVNVPTRVGFQTPFTNITMDLVIPENFRDRHVVIGGVVQEDCYGAFQDEVDLFNRAFAEVMVEGDANGSVFSFPIPTYNITKDFDWNNTNYDAIWEMTYKYGIPYFSNFVNSDLNPDDVRSMCCRLRLDKRELQRRGGGLFGANPLTGSIGVVTVNLPQLGYLYKSKEDFFAALFKNMVLAKESLEIKRKVIERFTEQGLYPYSKFYLRHLHKRDKAFWNNHFSTIGIIGMNECLMNMIGEPLVSRNGHALAVEIMDFMRECLSVFQEETGHIYNLEATPGEGTCYRLAKIDTEQFDGVYVSNHRAFKEDGAAPYYTNSTHVPVDYSNDLLEVLSLQEPLQTRYTGGTVFHTFVGERQLNGEAVKRWLQKVTSNYKLPYITLSPTFSICPEHGYLYGEHYYCPKCEKRNRKRVCTVYSRIVGYLRPVNQWNSGKQSEFRDRALFDKSSKTFLVSEV
ncbi:ribonucleoside triphosphate reductase [Halosquirtibacter xylanolyticus]|uniref:ribonucleoside triphosphate reductase n=1 Tax=Halosquirtibacter xylanolyticus TaxID=3374599 RepID=UPI0037495339|nr:ribonucleoside triphosphate reductase [Prolixibacteraceae bacterium]